MGLTRRLLKLTTYTTTATLGAFFYSTRNSTFTPLPATDHIFHSSHFHALNPERNPTTHDLCVRRVPLSDIQPALLEKKGALVEAFCAGVWSGWGMFFFPRWLWGVFGAGNANNGNTEYRIRIPTSLPSEKIPGPRNGHTPLVPRGTARFEI